MRERARERDLGPYKLASSGVGVLLTGPTADARAPRLPEIWATERGASIKNESKREKSKRGGKKARDCGDLRD